MYQQDWRAAKVNAEGTAYYYIRARVTSAYTTTPVGVQMAAIPQINWASATGFITGGAIYTIWTDNAATPRIRLAATGTNLVYIRGGTKITGGTTIKSN